MNPKEDSNTEMILEELDEIWTKINSVSVEINEKLWMTAEPGSGTEQDYNMAQDRLSVANEMINKAMELIREWEDV